MAVIAIVTLDRKTGKVLNSVITDEQCTIDYGGVVEAYADKYMKEVEKNKEG